jgi:hypothetical protein
VSVCDKFCRGRENRISCLHSTLHAHGEQVLDHVRAGANGCVGTPKLRTHLNPMVLVWFRDTPPRRHRYAFPKQRRSLRPVSETIIRCSKAPSRSRRQRIRLSGSDTPIARGLGSACGIRV